MQRNLDVLRALAVLLVLVGHLELSHHPTDALEIVAHMGVLLFFVHTSYVLMLSLERLSTGHKDFSRNAVTFYIRRAFRIYPLAMVAVISVALLGAPYLVPEAQKVLPFFANLFLVQNLTLQPYAYGSLWTLPVELQMYLFLPFCFVMAKQSVRLAVLFGAFSVSVGILAAHSGSSLYYFALYSPCFASGVLAYALTRHHSNVRKLSGKYWVAALFVVVTAAGFIFQPHGGHNIAYDWATSLSVALLIPLFKDMSLSWLSKAAFQVAKYSYGIYLFHIPIMNLVHNSWIGTIGLTGIASVIGYHLIESPFIKLGQRVTAKEPLQADTLLTVPAP